MAADNRKGRPSAGAKPAAGARANAKKDLPARNPVKAGRKAGGGQQDYFPIKP